MMREHRSTMHPQNLMIRWQRRLTKWREHREFDIDEDGEPFHPGQHATQSSPSGTPRNRDIDYVLDADECAGDGQWEQMWKQVWLDEVGD